MPNSWTHLIFGQKVMEELGHMTVLNDKQLRHTFSLGCQGPDFLFYHNFLPWKKDKTLNELGSLMHQKSCGPFLFDLIQQVQGRGLYNPAVLYVLGFVTHHVLDRNLHPYVFYKSGFKKWDHQRFEIIMDTIYARKERNIQTWQTPVWKEIYVGETFPLGIVPALSAAANLHYPQIASKLSDQDWQDAYFDMIRAQRLFHDPSGLKRLLTFGQISPFVFKKHPAPLDYFNESKTVWNCPTDLQETYTYSAWELFDTAMIDAISVLSVTIQALQSGHGADYEALRVVLGNRSYETGKDCELDLPLTYVNSIL